jgi:hypothetical protein
MSRSKASKRTMRSSKKSTSKRTMRSSKKSTSKRTMRSSKKSTPKRTMRSLEQQKGGEFRPRQPTLLKPPSIHRKRASTYKKPLPEIQRKPTSFYPSPPSSPSRSSPSSSTSQDHKRYTLPESFNDQRRNTFVENVGRQHRSMSGQFHYPTRESRYTPWEKVKYFFTKDTRQYPPVFNF